MRGLKCVTTRIAGHLPGRIPYGMRGLKSYEALHNLVFRGRRIPYGMRGLKFYLDDFLNSITPSHPIRDAWIEISNKSFLSGNELSRIPYGMRGLKFILDKIIDRTRPSHPIRDAWIEISCLTIGFMAVWSHPIRDAWIEILSCAENGRVSKSHPIRDAWIEMMTCMKTDN